MRKVMPVATILAVSLGALVVALCPSPSPAQCAYDSVSVWDGSLAGTTLFSAPQDIAGVIFAAPADHYPIEVLAVRILYTDSPFFQQELLLYGHEGTFLNPGPGLFILADPVLSPLWNTFVVPGNKIVNSGPVAIALMGDETPPDGNMPIWGSTCTPGTNFYQDSNTGIWTDTCQLGQGDLAWFLYYRQVNCATSAPEVLASTSLLLSAPQPSPFREGTRLTLLVDRERHAQVGVYDVTGRLVASLADRTFAAGAHELRWDGTADHGGAKVAGVYFVTMLSEGHRETRKVVLAP
jgi:hypothetical protein